MQHTTTTDDDAGTDYEAPAVAVLGTLAEITRGNGGANFDGIDGSNDTGSGPS